MKGLQKSLNSLATRESSRAYSIATKKEDCRLSFSYTGCKHNPTRNRVAAAALVDIARDNYVPETREEVHELMGSMYLPTEVGTELVDGMFLMPNGDYHVVELKAGDVIQLEI